MSDTGQRGFTLLDMVCVLAITGLGVNANKVFTRAANALSTSS